MDAPELQRENEGDVRESLLESGGGDVTVGGGRYAHWGALWGSLARSSMLDNNAVVGGRGKERRSGGHNHYGSSNGHIQGHIHDPPHYSGDPSGGGGSAHRQDDNSNHHAYHTALHSLELAVDKIAIITTAINEPGISVDVVS